MDQEIHERPPYDIEIEQRLLGSMMADSSTIGDAKMLAPESFYEELHGQIFRAIIKTDAESPGAASARTIYPILSWHAGLNEIGGSEYLHGLQSAAPALPRVQPDVKTITDLAKLRTLIKVGENIVNGAIAEQHETPPSVQVAEAIAALNEISITDIALETVCAADLAGQPVPERLELVEGLIPRRTVTGLSGDGGTGKSLAALQLSVAVHLGTNWFGRVILERGAVLYLSAEDELEEIHRRLYAIAAAERIGLHELPGLHIVPLAAKDALLGILTPQGTIAATPLFHAIEARIKSLRTALVVLDTLSDLFGGDENVRTQARQFVSQLRRLAITYDTTILLLAHPSLTGMSSGSGASGSTAWSNSMRSRLYLDRVRDNGSEDDPDLRVLRCKKANYGPTSAEIKLRWQHGVFVPITAERDDPVAAAAQARADRTFIELLTAYNGNGIDVGPKKGRSFAPAVFSEDKRAQGIKSKLFIDAMNRLLEHGRITVEMVGPPSRRTHRLVVCEATA